MSESPGPGPKNDCFAREGGGAEARTGPQSGSEPASTHFKATLWPAMLETDIGNLGSL